MTTRRSIAISLLHASAGLFVLFGLFMTVNVFVWGKAPALMEDIMGRSSAEIAAFDPDVLLFFLSGFRMFTILLLVYAGGLIVLTRRFARGDAAAGQVVFAMQAAFTLTAGIYAPTVSLRAPWPVFVISGLLTLVAFVMLRTRGEASPRTARGARL